MELGNYVPYNPLKCSVGVVGCVGGGCDGVETRWISVVVWEGRRWRMESVQFSSLYGVRENMAATLLRKKYEQWGGQCVGGANR